MAPIEVNGIPGVTHGSYDFPRSWIDWWFKAGSTMLCICLLSKEFPVTLPTDGERALHLSIIDSMQLSASSTS